MAESTVAGNTAGKIALTIAFFTLVVTGINGLPAFMALHGQEPYVAYEVESAQMTYPDDADRGAIRQLLSSNRIPDAFVSITLSNRGDVSAREVIVTVRVP